MAEEKGWVELIWDGKRERFVSKESLDRNYGPVRDAKRISLPFQRMELLGIDKKRQNLPFFPSGRVATKLSKGLEKFAHLGR